LIVDDAPYESVVAVLDALKKIGIDDGLRADRERALLCVGYETLTRRSELVALQIRDIDFHPDGTGLALIRRGKTDAEGRGEWHICRARQCVG
jgi:integrase